MQTDQPDTHTPAHSTGGLVSRLLALSWSYRWGCLKVLILQLVILTLGLSGLGFTGLGIDVVRHKLDPSANPPTWPFGIHPPEVWTPLTTLAAIALAVLLFALVRGALTAFYTVALAELVQGRIVVDLRTKVFEKLQRLSFRFFDANASGSIINRVTGDVQSVRLFVDGVVMQGIITVLSLGVYLVYMTSIHAPLTLACLAVTPLIWITSAKFSTVVRPAYRRNRELVDKLVLRIAETVQGIHVIKGFALEAEFRERFARSNSEVRDQQSWVFLRVSIFTPLIGLLSQISLVVLLGYGGWLVIHNELPLGTGLVVFAGMLQQFSGQIANIATIADHAQQSLTGAGRVFEVLDTPVEIHSPLNPTPMGKVQAEVEFRDVSFEHAPGQRVLDRVSFVARAGSCVALVGETGAGKSTILSLIPRFYDPTSGSVLVDGRDIRELDLDTLRRNVGLVFQESFLFSATIAANIAFGNPDASDAQIEAAARAASAHEFICRFPNGYQTPLKEGGSNLSGGQRQRLAIARAILLQPPILILDDPTAAVDPETEGEILDAMDSAMAGRTTFIVAHRLSTLRRANHILVMEKGRIVERGTHEELMRGTGPYRSAAILQMADPESRRLLEQWEGNPHP